MQKNRKKLCYFIRLYNRKKHAQKKQKKFCVTFSGYVIEQKKHIQIIKQLNY